MPINFDDTVFSVKFKNNEDKIDVTLQALSDDAIDFLEHYGEKSIVGKEFYKIIGDGTGEEKYRNMLKAAGHESDSRGFFTEVIKILEQANSENAKPIRIGDITLPYLLVLSFLEKMILGDRFVLIKNVDELEQLTNVNIPEEDKANMQKVLDTYPVRLSMHVIRQMHLSKAVAYQYMPFVDELNPEGLMNTWIGQFHKGVLERMYQNRPIFVLNMSCPVYCRFCFRKHKECRNQPTPEIEDVKQALEYIGENEKIKEVVLTGGDPFMNRATLTCAVDGLKEIPHIQTLRLATRSIAYYPYLFYDNDEFWLNYLKMKSLELRQLGKRLEIATHFIHPDEISLDSLDIISELVKNGIAVYVQTPFLDKCNNKGPEMVELYSKLRGAGAEMHYIYIPCSPIQGNRVYVTPFSEGLTCASYIRAHLSDRAIPRTCTATCIGKIDWNTSGWMVEQDKEDKRYTWIRTPYTEEYFKDFAPGFELKDARANEEGTLDARFMTTPGDEKWVMGPRKKLPSKDNKVSEEQLEKDLEQLKEQMLKDQRWNRSIVDTKADALKRLHETRVEVDCLAENAELEKAMQYIEKDDRITDVIISSKKDAAQTIHKISLIIKRLYEVNHVNAIRLRSYKFNYAPEVYTAAVIDKLEDLNRLRILHPKRVEIETTFLHASEFRREHAILAKELNMHGVTVYNNTPILAGVNDNEEALQKICYKCRKLGIEFHHLYVAGHPSQKHWNKPFEVAYMIDFATYIRKFGSGREIPRYIIATELGQVDFGLSSRIVGTDGKGTISLKLLPYDIDYYKNMQSDFSKEVKTDADGKPIVQVSGLLLPEDDTFLLRKE